MAKFDQQYDLNPIDEHELEPETINPYLSRDKLAFYSESISLSKRDKVKALESELIKDY